MEIKTGRFISASVKGANHTDKGISCQDAAISTTMHHRGYLFNFMAVADGHGGAEYTRSDVGSFLALQAASESANRFIVYVIDNYEKYPDNWIDMVKTDFSDRFGKMLVNSWVRMAESHADEIENNPDEIIKLYGTTISVALVFNNHLFTGRIGDSSVYAVANKDLSNSSVFARLGQNKKLEARNLFEKEDEENTNLGLGTASLCSRDAHRKWQAHSIPMDDLQMLFLATDGFSDSLKDPKKEILLYYRYIGAKGFISFEKIINKELNKISQKGVGDDISLVVYLADQNYGGYNG